MRFRYIFVTIILLALSIAGCTSSSAPDSTPITTPLTTPSASPTSTQTPPVEEEWSPDGIIKAGEYSGSNTYGDYTIHWRADEQFIYIGITAKTNGWVSMAIQPGSRMKNADMVLGFVKDGKAEVMDLYSTDDFGSHPTDTELGGTYDIMAIGGKEGGGFTTIEFKRSLTTGDNYDIPITEGVNKIIWSYGSSDNPTIKHSDRGYGEINL